MNQNRLLAILLGVLASLVLVVGGLSAFLLLSGGEDADDGGLTTEGGAGVGGTRVEATSGRLRLASGDPITMDPALATDALSAEYIVEVFGGLVTLDPDLNIVPDLAESWEITGEGRVYTFVLRQDARFHSGRRVTAEDVRYSIDRAASRQLASPTALAYLGDIVGVRERFFGIASSIAGMEVVDDRTIRFTIDAPKPYFLAKLTYPTAFVVDKEQVEANPRNWTRRPNGTGPFRMVDWRLGERIVLEAYTDYHLGAPKLREVIYLLSGGSQLTRWENNELDVAPITVNDVDRARDPNSDIGPYYQAFPQFSISYLAFNTSVPPFDDPHVRRALGHAIDRHTIANVTFFGMIEPATGILMPGFPGYVQEDLTLPFDPDRARAELAQSRYANNMPPIVITEVGAGAEASVDMQAFLDQWSSILGLTIEIRQTDFATFLADQDAGRLQAFNAGWIMDYADPEDILDLLFHSGSALNRLEYSNPELDAILDVARTEQDPSERLRLYQQAQAMIIDDAIWIPLYFGRAHQVIRPEVQGYFEPPMVMPRLRFIEVNR